MNDPNAEKIRQFLQDTIMYAAVRRILEQQFDLNFVKEDKGQSNEALGEITRACIHGGELLNIGFKELERFRVVEQEKKTEDNPAF